MEVFLGFIVCLNYDFLGEDGRFVCFYIRKNFEIFFCIIIEIDLYFGGSFFIYFNDLGLFKF